ncbi:MAG: hypothetical protein PHN63_04615 [Candidatus Omnitrophica bacterium]|nr:hypothetical protein [Candidatus Omnitrophota bacterium]
MELPWAGQTRSGAKAAGFFLLVFAVQVAVFHFIDPLGSQDTIRYLNFADFLQSPHTVHFGDLGYNNGLLFTPLFLPCLLAFFKKIAGLPYIATGIALEFISFQMVVWLTYAIALRIDGKRTAGLAVALLLTNLAFCLHSAFILTEYPFMAVLLLTLLYIISTRTISSKRSFILSLLFGFLVSIRVQGFLFILFIVIYLLYSGRARLRQILILCSIPAAYLLFYICTYLYMDHRFPQTITANEIFSLNVFFLGDNFAGYDFTLHGVEALAVRKASFYMAWLDPKTYLSLIAMRSADLFKYLSTGQVFYSLFLGALALLAIIFSRVREKTFLTCLILFNFSMIIFSPVHYDSLLRYQGILFPLVIILIASSFVHGDEDDAGRGRRRPVLLFAVLLYLAYFVVRHYDFFQATYADKYNRGMLLRREAIDSARLISNEIGHDHNAVASDPLQYNMIYRSGNMPVYFFEGWERRAIVDYFTIRDIRYLVAKYGVIDRLKRKGVPVGIVSQFPPGDGRAGRLFLCEWKDGGSYR